MTITVETRDRYVTTNGLRFHYREWGSASAPPLLILHGITGHAWEFDGVASALAEQYHVLAVNQRGHGASAWAEAYSPAVMAEDVAALIDVLGLERVHVLGHSMGGANTWWFAAAHPERVGRIIIADVDPRTITAEEIVNGMVAGLRAYALAEYANPEEAVTEYLAGYGGSQQKQLRTFVLNNLKMNGNGRWIWRFDAAGLIRWLEQAAADEEAHWSRLRQLACPVLAMRADESPFTTRHSMERMVREIPQAQLVEIPGTGHDIHIDQAEAFVREARKHYAA